MILTYKTSMGMYKKATHYKPFEKYDITLVKSTRRVPFDEFLTNPVWQTSIDLESYIIRA